MTFPQGTVNISPTTLNLNPSGNINVSPGGAFQALSGNVLRAYDSGNTKYAQIGHDGTNGKIFVSSGALDVGQGKDIYISALVDFYLAGNTHARVKAQKLQISDDATGVFMEANNSSYRLHILVSTYNSTTFGIWFQTSSQAPQLISGGSNFNLAATNPDVDTDVNVWPSSATGISVKNRMGSARWFTLYSIGV